MPVATPHIRYPFARVRGKLGVVEQDTPEHVMSCELVIAVCPVGARDDRPEFGWAWPELATPPLDLESLRSALAHFEPRGTPTATQYADLYALALQHINVDVQIASDTDDDHQ